MNDRELLELAAKAAGIKGETMFVEELGAWFVLPDFSEWNPLTDDGDALRLAVNLRLDIFINGPDSPTAFVEVVSPYTGAAIQHLSEEPMGNDQYAATRRAIVRAAAEIGKAM